MMKSRAALFLAAGQQTRFKADHLKCLSEIGGKPLLQHSARAWRNHDLYIVVSSVWKPNEVAFVRGLGFTVVHSEGRTIGMSLHDGLVTCEPHLYKEIAIVAADTFFVDDDIPENSCMAIFDPDEWVTLWCLRRQHKQQRPSSYHNMTGRVQRMIGAQMPVRLVRWNWINVNTTEDLERARRLWDDTCKLTPG